MTGAFRCLLAALALLLTAAPLHATVIEAEGAALIRDGDMERARELAIQDAKNQVGLQLGAKVEASSIVTTKGLALESSRVRPVGTIEKFSVIREWKSGELLRVRIGVHVGPDEARPVSLKYRKKILATAFTVRKSYQSDDLDNASNGLAAELLRRLEAGGKFLGKKSQYILPPTASGPSQDSEAVIHLATINDSQFVVTGELLDAGDSDEGGYLGMFQHKRRRFEIEFYIYDGLTGALIARHRVEQSAIGAVGVGRDKTFGNASFLSTSYGQAIARAIDAAVVTITRELEDLPFTAKIIRIADGQLYLDAGGTSMLAPGDKLVAYRLKRSMAISAPDSGANYGLAETPVGTITLTQVQPLFAIAAPPPGLKLTMLEVGDLVRFDFAGQAAAANAGTPF